GIRDYKVTGVQTCALPIYIVEKHDWKKILMFGAFGAAVYFLLSGRRAAGMASAGVGLAALASDHPEKFEQIWNQAPEYLDRGHRSEERRVGKECRAGWTAE